MRLWIAPTAFLALATVSGCEAPVSYTGLPMTPYDRNTAFRVDDTPSGFTLFVRQSRYQYILNDAIQTSCTQAIKSLAQEIAERRGHKVEIDGDRVQMSFGRNGVNGISTCSAMVPVIWSGHDDAGRSLALLP
jgi:hypothetical protein